MLTDPHRKLIPFEALAEWRAQQASARRRVVVTNGCFDVLHAGHVTYLYAARVLGDLLLVGLNSDDSVRQLKGPDRPWNCQADRALVLASLAAVDAVCIFPEPRADRFLHLAQPSIYVKGGDLKIEQIPEEERSAVRACGGEIRIMPWVEGRSTTETLRRMGIRNGLK